MTRLQTCLHQTTLAQACKLRNENFIGFLSHLGFSKTASNSKRNRNEKKRRTISGSDLKQQLNSSEHRTYMEERIPHGKNLPPDH